MLTKVEFTYEDSGVVNGFRRFDMLVRVQALPSAADRLARTIRRVMLRHVPVDTGRLRNSITWVETSLLKRVIFADTPYARVVEFGYQGIQIISPHRRLQTHVFGRPITPQLVDVSAHTRFVNRRPKPYIRPGLAHGQERAIPLAVEEIRKLL